MRREHALNFPLNKNINWDISTYFHLMLCSMEEWTEEDFLVCKTQLHKLTFPSLLLGGWHQHWPLGKRVLKGSSNRVAASRKDTRHRVCHSAERGTTDCTQDWSSSSTDKIAVGPLPDVFQTVNNMYNWWIHMTFSIPPVRRLIKEILLLLYLISSGILVPEILLGKGKSGKLKGYWTAL